MSAMNGPFARCHHWNRLSIDKRSVVRVAWVCSLLATSSCMSLIAKKHTYMASSSPVEVNGAQIRMQVKPEGTDGGTYAVSAMVVGAAMATFDGPFRWRLEAVGTPGKQESLIVHRIRTRTTATKRDEWYPTSHLNERAAFRTLKSDPSTARAIYSIPGLLVVKPREDGNLEILVDLSVRSNGRSIRKTVSFRMNPTEKRGDEFIFLPTEIAENIGKSPSDWDEKGWD